MVDVKVCNLHAASSLPADDAGVTQTPPAVRQAIADTLGATQRPPAACQQQQQQQRAVSPPPPQLQQQAAEPEQPEPTAAQEWSDAETVASEPPPAGDLVVSDSESDEEPVPAPRPQQPAAAQPQQPPASVAGRPSAAQKRGGLLQVSRPGQAASSGRLPVAPWPLSQPREQAPAAAAAAAGGHEAAQPSPCADWVPAMSGSLDALPAAAAGPPAVDDYGSPGQAAAGSPPQQQEWPAGSPDLQGLVATGRRLLLPQQAPAARPSVRDWSEDDSDEFPTPTGGGAGSCLPGAPSPPQGQRRTLRYCLAARCHLQAAAAGAWAKLA